MYIVYASVAYLLISMSVTLWVAWTLHRNGGVFLIDAFHNNARLADSVNHLLVVGLCLVSLGYIAMTLTTNTVLTSEYSAIEFVCDRTGGLLLIVGVAHMGCLLISSILRRSASLNKETK